jgi:hypothetical protein
VLARRSARLACLISFAGELCLAGCATQQAIALPARPVLPAVNYVRPCDPAATVGLTPDGVEQLRARDEAWRTHVEALEAAIRRAR